MVEVPQIFYTIMSVDTSTLSSAVAMALLAGIIVKWATHSNVLTLTYTPVLYFGALVGIHVSRDFGIVLVASRNANTIAAAAGGMMVALLLMLLISRGVYAYSSTRKTGLEERIKDDGTGAYTAHQSRLPF